MHQTKTNGMMAVAIFAIMGWNFFVGLQDRSLEAIRFAIKENTQYFKE